MANVSQSMQTLISEPYPEGASQIGLCQQERHAQSNLVLLRHKISTDLFSMLKTEVGLAKSKSRSSGRMGNTEIWRLYGEVAEQGL